MLTKGQCWIVKAYEVDACYISQHETNVNLKQASKVKVLSLQASKIEQLEGATLTPLLLCLHLWNLKGRVLFSFFRLTPKLPSDIPCIKVKQCLRSKVHG
jgi:hypothetical protein